MHGKKKDHDLYAQYLSWRWIALLFICIFTIPKDADAQEEIIDHQLWFDVIPHFDITQRLQYFGDASYRTSTTGDKFRRFVIRPSIRYSWTYELDLIAGVGLFVTWEETESHTIELRPYQGVRLNWPRIWKMNFKHRGLIEERLIWGAEGGFDPNLRLRYRIKTKFPINGPNIDYQILYLPLSYEIFANTGPKNIEQFHNRARAIVGLGYVFSDKWIGEFEMTFQRSRGTQDDELILSDRIFRFKLIYDGWIFGE